MRLAKEKLTTFGTSVALLSFFSALFAMCAIWTFRVLATARNMFMIPPM